MDNENLIDEAPDGQTSDEAVAETPATESVETDGAEASATAEQTPAQRLYAGKFKADTELEHGYINLEKEASRMAGELAAYKKGVGTQPIASDPIKATVDDLEKKRETWVQYGAQDNLSSAERARAMSEIGRFDRAIAKIEAKHEMQTEYSRTSASQTLESRALATIKTFEQDLAPGSPLRNAAEELYSQMIAAGDPDNNRTKAMAIRLAADELGIGQKRALSNDRKGLLDNLNRQAKAAVKVGAGTATPVKSGAITAKHIEQMSDAEFAKYERGLSLGA